MRMSITLLALSVLFLIGCATKSGPFVTNISSDGKGNLVIEKCMTQYDPWMATVSNADCINTTIYLGEKRD